MGNKSVVNHEPPRQEASRTRHHHLTCHESCVFDSVLLACAPTYCVPSQIWWSAVVLCHHVAKTDQLELNNKDLMNPRCSFHKCLLIFSQMFITYFTKKYTNAAYRKISLLRSSNLVIESYKIFLLPFSLISALVIETQDMKSTTFSLFCETSLAGIYTMTKLPLRSM